MDENFESYRPLLFSIAYRMLGSVMEAEDMVQETYLRYAAVAHDDIQSLKAFLTTITTRLCLDRLKSARHQREEYLGPWLPEPLITTEVPEMVVAREETISMAFLVLLERLSPVERAVFLLREVFDYDYAEIAAVVGKSEANCRQYFRRAKSHLVSNRPRFSPTVEEQQQLIGRFVGAVLQGDFDGLTGLLADDVAYWSDGGGRVSAATRPLHGSERVAKFLLGIFKKRPDDAEAMMTEINGQQSLLLFISGEVFGVMNFVGDGERFHEIRMVVNPDKLGHLNQTGGGWPLASGNVV